MACAHNKNRNPNDQDLAAMFPKNKKNKVKKEEKEDDARSGLLSGQGWPACQTAPRLLVAA